MANRLLLQFWSETHPNVTDSLQAAKRLSERGFMPKIGYARVSSSSQDLDIQKAKRSSSAPNLPFRTDMLKSIVYAERYD